MAGQESFAEPAVTAASLGICLALALGPEVFIPSQRFTLAWVHSIEKVRWEEDYAVGRNGDPQAPTLIYALAARVKGSAAGMEPGPGAVLKNGWYEYVPAVQRHESLSLMRSFYTPDYELCLNGHCRPMSDYLASDGGITMLRACEAPKPKQSSPDKIPGLVEAWQSG